MFPFWAHKATAINTHLVEREAWAFPAGGGGVAATQGALCPEYQTPQGFISQHCCLPLALTLPPTWLPWALSHLLCTRSPGLPDSDQGGGCSWHPSSGTGPFQPRRRAPDPLSAPCVSSLVKQQGCCPQPGRSVGFFQNVHTIMNCFLCKKVLKPTLKHY